MKRGPLERSRGDFCVTTDPLGIEGKGAKSRLARTLAREEVRKKKKKKHIMDVGPRTIPRTKGVWSSLHTK